MKKEDNSLSGHFFRCREILRREKHSWISKWSIIVYETDSKVKAEMVVEGPSGYMTVIFGEYRRGEYYICLPDLDVGCPLSFDVQDVFWNSERLSKHMNRIDALTIAFAVADFAKKTGWERYGRPCPKAELKHRLSTR